MRQIRYLDLVDFLIITEAVLGTDAEELMFTHGLGPAESALASPTAEFAGHEFYPTLEEKAAALCYHLIRNHPLPDGNKRVGYLCLVELVERNGYEWVPPTNDGPLGDETVKVIERVAAGSISQEALVAWVAERLGEPKY